MTSQVWVAPPPEASEHPLRLELLEHARSHGWDTSENVADDQEKGWEHSRHKNWYRFENGSWYQRITRGENVAWVGLRFLEPEATCPIPDFYRDMDVAKQILAATWGKRP